MTRTTSTTALAVGSLVALVGLVAALWLREHESRHDSLIVYVAPTCRLPMEAIAADYERETGQHVELRFGASEDLLTKVRFPSPVEPADLFIPADDSYIRQARERGLIAESIPLARVRAVVLLAEGNPRTITRWDDLLRDGVKVAIPNRGAAVGKLTRDHLENTQKWFALKSRVVDTGTVTEAANATRAGDRPAVDAAIVWDAVANAPAYRGQTILTLAELDGIVGRIEVAILNQSPNPVAARRFARYIAATDRGLLHFRDHRFEIGEGSGPWTAEAAPSRREPE